MTYSLHVTLALKAWLDANDSETNYQWLYKACHEALQASKEKPNEKAGEEI